MMMALAAKFREGNLYVFDELKCEVILFLFLSRIHIYIFIGLTCCFLDVEDQGLDESVENPRIRQRHFACSGWFVLTTSHLFYTPNSQFYRL